MCKVVQQIIGLFYILLFNHTLFGDKNAFAQKYLTINGTNLMLNGEKVFLSGMNQAWFRYGGDFGNTSYAISKPHLINTMDVLKSSGGNSISKCIIFKPFEFYCELQKETCITRYLPGHSPLAFVVQHAAVRHFLYIIIVKCGCQFNH